MRNISASIPLAIEIVTTTTLAIGSKNPAHHGAIIVKLSAFEDLAGMSTLCSDKTGTPTLNQMVLEESTPVYEEGLMREIILTYAAMAAKWKEPSRDALDRLTVGNVNMELMENYEQVDCMIVAIIKISVNKMNTLLVPQPVHLANMTPNPAREIVNNSAQAKRIAPNHFCPELDSLASAASVLVTCELLQSKAISRIIICCSRIEQIPLIQAMSR